MLAIGSLLYKEPAMTYLESAQLLVRAPPSATHRMQPGDIPGHLCQDEPECSSGGSNKTKVLLWFTSSFCPCRCPEWHIYVDS